MKFSVLIKVMNWSPQGALSLILPCGNTARGLQPGRGPSPDHGLRLLAPRTVRNRFLFISHSVYGTLLEWPELPKTRNVPLIGVQCYFLGITPALEIISFVSADCIRPPWV